MQSGLTTLLSRAVVHGLIHDMGYSPIMVNSLLSTYLLAYFIAVPCLTTDLRINKAFLDSFSYKASQFKYIVYSSLSCINPNAAIKNTFSPWGGSVC